MISPALRPLEAGHSGPRRHLGACTQVWDQSTLIRVNVYHRRTRRPVLAPSTFQHADRSWRGCSRLPRRAASPSCHKTIHTIYGGRRHAGPLSRCCEVAENTEINTANDESAHASSARLAMLQRESHLSHGQRANATYPIKPEVLHPAVPALPRRPSAHACPAAPAAVHLYLAACPHSVARAALHLARRMA